MQVIQSYNQNAVAVIDSKGKELVLVGKGIGFGKTKGDFIDTSEADKIFKYYYTSYEQKIVDSLGEISEDIILMSEEITEKSHEMLGEKLSSSFLFTLASHIQVAIERTETEGNFQSPFSYELKYIYPREYKTAQWAVNYIYENYDIKLADAEISFFTLHLINGLQYSDSVEDVLKLGEIINSVTSSIEEHFKISINKNDLAYSRFVLHLRYFIFRQLNNEEARDKRVVDLYEITKAQFPQANHMSQIIRDLLSNDYDIQTNEEESFYLLLHIQRLLDENYPISK